MAFDINTISLTKKIRSGLGFALLILAFTSTLSYYSIYTLIEKSKLVDHTHNVLINLENILNNLLDAESGVRGYVITNEPTFIESYQNNKLKTFELFSKLEKQSADNATIAPRIDSLEVLLKRRYEILDVVINLHRDNNDHNLIHVFKDGKLVMDDIKLKTEDLKNIHTQLQNERFATLKSLSGFTPIIIILSSLVS